MSKDHLIRMAVRIQRLLSGPTAARTNWPHALTEVLHKLRRVKRHGRLSQTARQRGWPSAAVAEERLLMQDIGGLETAIALLRQLYTPPHAFIPDPPQLGTIIAELKQLQNEFDDCRIDLKAGVIGVSTDPIELEGVNLGPFTIDLRVNALGNLVSSDCFLIVAGDPNPAGGNESITHPHVSDGRLCAGDASVPVRSALAEGRLADAFMLVRSVLQTYNAESPFVSLENWSGRRCADCDDLTESDSMRYCEDCNRDVCEDCYSFCDICDEGTCRGCLERDPVSNKRCCPGCRQTCSRCDRIVDTDHFDDETELCPECLELQTQEQEINDESNTESPEPAGGIAAIESASSTEDGEPIPATLAPVVAAA